jgi:site-specific recombinase XerD
MTHKRATLLNFWTTDPNCPTSTGLPYGVVQSHDPLPERAAGATRHGATSLADAIDAFLLSRQVANCTARTIELYREVLTPFRKAIGPNLSDCATLATQKYLATLPPRVNGTTLHLHFSKLRAFLSWVADVGLLPVNPLRGMAMRAPKTLPRIVENWEVDGLLKACPPTWEGVRNRTLVTLLADSGLRISEALRLCVSDVHFNTQTAIIRQGKGQVDRLGFFGIRTKEQMRVWLGLRDGHAPNDLLFCTRKGRPLTRYHGLHILHRLSLRAHLPQKIGPHALRHFAATSVLRKTGDLELVRRILGHSTLTMTLRYAHLTGTDVAARFQMASPVDNLTQRKRNSMGALGVR